MYKKNCLYILFFTNPKINIKINIYWIVNIIYKIYKNYKI